MSDASDQDSQISDYDMGPTDFELAQPAAKRAKLSGPERLIHFKVSGLQDWDYEAEAYEFFAGSKCIVQYEKLSDNPHVHFQGYTSLGPDAIKKRVTALSAKHPTRKVANSRPVKMVRTGLVNEIGFQYLMKEGHQPLHSIGFTPEELEELKAKSDLHVEELKMSLFNYLVALKFDATTLNINPSADFRPKTLLTHCVTMAMREYYNTPEMLKKFNMNSFKLQWARAMQKHTEMAEAFRISCAML